MRWLWRRGWLWGLILGFCSVVGWGISAWGQNQESVQPSLGTLRLGAALYVERCGRCHLPVPPQVLPTDTWRVLIQDANHYGVQLQPLPRLDFNLIWPYLRTYSRSVRQGESVPYRVGQSRFFRVLHPGLTLEPPITLGRCLSCHPAAKQLDYVTLNPNWEKTLLPQANPTP